MKKKVIIIGGGASGLIAAIAAADQGADVTILEHMDRVGRKILSTGNGRCNMTNLAVRPECFRCSQKPFPMKILDRFSVWDTLTFFDEIGIVTKSKGGYIYPNSEQASAVLDMLRLETESRGVTVHCDCHVAGVEFSKKNSKSGFRLRTSSGEFDCDALILATGSKAAPATGSDGSGYELARAFGHNIIEPLPALVQLRCQGKHYKQLAGIRCEAELKLVINQKTVVREEGELQLTDYGLSGIPTFQISRFASVALANGEAVTVYVDFLPSKTKEETRRFLKQRGARTGSRTSEHLLLGVLNKKLATVLLKQAGIAGDLPMQQISTRQWDNLVKQIKEFEAVVMGTNSFEQAQVCCGGADTKELRPETMESKLVSGLYLVGELVDVDGICGGYNLQWAWSTGMIAGRSAGR